MSSCESKEFIDVSQKKQGTTEQSEFITLKSGAIVEKHGDKYIWQDDILLSDAQYKLLDETGDIIQDPANEEVLDASNAVRVSLTTGYDYIPYDVKTRSTAIYPTPYNMWAMVRFTYAKEGTGTTLNANTRELIRQALHHWEANTNVRFYNATDQPTIDPTYGFAYPYVNFCDGTSNQSYVGRIGGRQDLTLVPGDYQPFFNCETSVSQNPFLIHDSRGNIRGQRKRIGGKEFLFLLFVYRKCHNITLFTRTEP